MRLLYSQYYTISDTDVGFPHVKQIFGSTWVPYTLIPTLSSRRKHQKQISSLGASNHKVKVAQSALCNPMDCSLPGSSVHGIFQAILGGIAISFSRGYSQPWDPTQVSCIAGNLRHSQARSQNKALSRGSQLWTDPPSPETGR